MKTRITLLLFLFSFLLNHVGSAQILTNVGFENWATGTSGYLDPVAWNTSNGLGIGASVAQAPGRTGTYSANLISVPDSNSQIMQAGLGFVYMGNLKPLVLSGYWKGNFLATGDYLYVSIMVFDASFANIGFGSAYSPMATNVTNWTPFSATINYTSSTTPVQTVIQFSLFSSSLNTTGFVDDLTLTYSGPAGVSQTTPLSGSALSCDFSGNYSLNLDIDFPSNFTFSIFSAEGKMISEKKYELASGQHHIPLQTQELTEGIYFCHLKGDTINKSFKMIK